MVLVCSDLFIGLDRRRADTPEHKATTGKAPRVLDAAILGLYIDFGWLLLVKGFSLEAFALPLNVLLLLQFNLCQFLLVLVGLMFVAPAKAEGGEAIADGVTSEMCLAHVVILLAEFEKDQTVHQLDDERDCYHHSD